MSFFTGFVEGLATSANEALQNDIKRINTRIDDVANIKFKRALDDQEERKEEYNEVSSLLKEAGALFDNDPYAADYAAGLLKNSGSINAFKKTIEEIRAAKKGNVPLAQFVQRASVDSPSGTYKDYANAYVDSSRTLPDSPLPKDTSNAGGLISSILGKPIDISSRADTQVASQMEAAGIVPRKETTLTAPEITFDREGIQMYQMSPSERVTYIREELARPSIGDERTKELKGFLTSNLEQAKKEGDLKTQLSALETQLGYADTDERRTQLKGSMKSINRQISLNNALDEKSKLLVQAEHASQDGNPDEARKLKRQAEDMTSGPTVEVLIARSREDLDSSVSLYIRTDGKEGIAPDSEEAKNKMSEIDALQLAADKNSGALKLDIADRTAAINIVDSAFQDTLKAAVTARPKLFTTDEFKKPVIIPGLEDDLLLEAQAIERKAMTDAVDNAISMTDSVKEKIALEFYRDQLLMQGRVNPKTEDKDTDVSEQTADTLSPEGQQKPPQKSPLKPDLTVGEVIVPAANIESMASANKIDFATAKKGITRLVRDYSPNDINSADEFAMEVPPEKFEQRIQQIDSLGVYTDEWIAEANNAFKNRMSPINKAVDIVQNTFGYDSKLIRTIARNLGVDKVEAERLLIQAKKEIKRQEQEEKANAPVSSRRTARTGYDKNNGGLMSR
jgi:hypothetical protein